MSKPRQKPSPAAPPTSVEVREMVNAWLDGVVGQLTAIRNETGDAGGLLAPHLSERQQRDLREELDNAIAAVSNATVFPDKNVTTADLLAALREGGAA